MSSTSEHVYLVFGKNGWIGGKLIQLLTEQGKKFHLATARNYDRESVLAEVEKYKPTHILNASGVTGRPNVDWCEDNKLETIRTNVIGTLTIADICATKNIHHLLYATGCIFEYDDEHQIGGKTFTEEDRANFHGSFYSHTKALCEDLLRNYPNTCTLRVRMPISDDLSPRNFVTKIVKYDRVVNIPNSMTVLTDLLPISLIMAERGLTGIYNFCNPGAISHNEVLDLYKKYVDPSYTYTNFTVEEQAKILKAGRSNNTLDHRKLCEALPDIHIPEIHESMERVFQRMRVNLEKEGIWPDNLPKRAK
jgi:dTDP-4-dehydrorhamnose reductase